jgi:hypothetical protein
MSEPPALAGGPGIKHCQLRHPLTQVVLTGIVFPGDFG